MNNLLRSGEMALVRSYPTLRKSRLKPGGNTFTEESGGVNSVFLLSRAELPGKGCMKRVNGEWQTVSSGCKELKLQKAQHRGRGHRVEAEVAQRRKKRGIKSE
jgi:hypothetical protein